MKQKLILLMVVLLMVSSPVSAYEQFINGTTNRSDTNSSLGSVYVYETYGNSTTSNASGYFSMCCMQNNTAGWNLTAQFNGTDSYTAGTTVVVVNNANVTDVRLLLVVKVPAISSLAASSITKTGATVSWTSNVSNVGNMLRYSTDSNFASNTFNTTYSNSTTSPSFALSNLRVYTKYYTRASTGNIVNSNTTYTTTSDSSFTTGHGYVEDELPLESIAKAVVKTPKPTAKPAIDLSAITGKKGTGISGKGVVMLLAFIVVAGIVAYAWQASKSTGKSKKKR